jgi:hypothetical protein
MSYDLTAFRLVKHGIDEITADCRHCNWAVSQGDVKQKAKTHAKSNLHTVDVYQTNHTEYTSHIKESSNKESSNE